MKCCGLKKKVLNIWFRIYDYLQFCKVQKAYPISVMTSEQTVDYIKKHNCSIARYGDGDLGLMLKSGAEGYQEITDELSAALKNVFKNTDPKLLICMPYPMVSTKEFLPHGKRFWRQWCIRWQEKVVTTINQLTGGEYAFGDSFVSRPYTGYKNESKSKTMFPLLKELWDQKDILIVEGEGTRMGIGNDLFTNARSIKRVLAPAENAFTVYSKILDSVLAHWNGELIIAALGPTATVLASDLSRRGIQALDIGHIDVQYEWYLSGKPYKPIANKYVNEAKGGNTLVEYTDPVYQSQIIDRIILT